MYFGYFSVVLPFPSHPKINIRVCWSGCVTNTKGRVRPTNVRWGGASNILRNASGGPRNHLTHQMLNLKPFFEYWQFEFACRRQHPLVIPHYLQVAVSAADSSSTRWLDDRMLKRIAGGIVVPERKDSNLACLEAWFLGWSVPHFLWNFTNLRDFVDLHGFTKSFTYFNEFSNMFIDFYNLNRVHKILWSFKTSLIFIYFGVWPLKTVRSGLLPLEKPLLDSKLFSFPLIVFCRFWKFFMISGMHLGKVRPVAHRETFARFQVGFLSSC